MEEKRLDDIAKVDAILREYQGQSGTLIPILQTIQETFGYLPRHILEDVADKQRMPLSSIYGVATFYSQFHVTPRGENVIRVCLGTACHVREANRVLEAVSEELNIQPGETTPDLKFTLEEVACIGACGLAPAMMVNDETFGRLDRTKVKEILQRF